MQIELSEEQIETLIDACGLAARDTRLSMEYHNENSTWGVTLKKIEDEYKQTAIDLKVAVLAELTK